MNKHIFNDDGSLKEVVKATPVCMEDFCDSCGDCLVCNGEDDCGGIKNNEHYWVEYLDE